MTPMTINARPPAPAPYIEDAEILGATPRIAGFVFAGLLVVLFFAGGAVFWAATQRLDGAIVAPASFVVEGNRKTVDHIDGGILRAIHVADGDMVEAGQVLAELDGAEIAVDLDVLGSQLGELTVREARLRAQLAGAEQFDRSAIVGAVPVPEAYWRAAFVAQQELFTRELSARRSEEAILAQRIDSLNAQIAGLEEQRDFNRRQLEIGLKELEGLRSLLASGLVVAPRVNAREIEIERLRGADASFRTQQAQLTDQIGSLRLAALGETRLRQETAASEIAAIHAQVAALRPQYEGVLDRLERVRIVAPVSGRVVDLSLFTVGGVVRPGVQLMDIVPEDGDLVVEARVNTGDIEALRIGQRARVRLSAYEQGDIPEASAEITDISADSLLDERTGDRFYLVRTVLDEMQPAPVAALDLVPGMPADLFFSTGEQTALNYLISPFRKRIARTFIEQE
ncbi:HlyD family type I secretion periplasmic adaptor subunit [Jannaschia marina]|uniref:HlyD family type I secretion periplasmic adaptor subunit n=1 Tax=Jannaschia marina TaxID=2741674 RepID=UPI0015CE4BC2|nr:HlyD family type I secretion periplasmic adaptor subunit [Jannaschia marina]